MKWTTIDWPLMEETDIEQQFGAIRAAFSLGARENGAALDKLALLHREMHLMRKIIAVQQALLVLESSK